MTKHSTGTADSTAGSPRTFWQYLRSFGPGFVVVLTWLGAGDVIEAGTSGANYGYSLMWIIVLAVALRFAFVSLIAKYQLCNQHSEGVLDGLYRLHPWYAPFLMIVSVVMGHAYGSYMTVAVGESWANLTGRGQPWQWALFWILVALSIVFRPVYRRVELLFKLLLAVLAVSFLGIAGWCRPDWAAMAGGLTTFQLPERQGAYSASLLVMGTLGAMGGSLMNLAYPYFLEQKGWRGPEYRRVQTYDFLLAVVVMIVLNVAVWTVGAEVAFPRGAQIENLEDLPGLLTTVLGPGGKLLFYLGFFAAVYTSLVGHAFALASMAGHGYLRWMTGPGPLASDYRTHSVYRFVVVWILVSPLVWTMPGMPGTVPLTLVTNSLQVLLIPVLAGGLWWITAADKYIGPRYKNRWWENLFMCAVFTLAFWATYAAGKSVYEAVRQLW